MSSRVQRVAGRLHLGLLFAFGLFNAWPDLQLVEVNGASRGALPGGDARHMLLQDSLLGALAVQVIWGLCWAASRTLGTLDQR